MPRNRGELLRTIQGKLKLLDSLSNDVDALIEVTRQEEHHLRAALTNLFPGASRGRPGRPATRSGPRKRGRAFKFTDEQAGAFRKRVEDGTTATALAKELRVSLPTMYNTLKRVGWKG